MEILYDNSLSFIVLPYTNTALYGAVLDDPLREALNPMRTVTADMLISLNRKQQGRYVPGRLL